MKAKSTLARLRRLAGAFCVIALAPFCNAAAPTIKWDATLYNAFPTPNPHGYYQAVRAMAHDDDGNLTAVRVDYLNPATNSWTPFAWNGGGNGTDNSSDANFIQVRGDGRAQAFRAQAFDSSNNQTHFIYLLVKAGGSSFDVDDLPVEPASGRRFVPNAYNYQITSRILGQALNSLNGRTGYTIWFKDGTYDLDSSWSRSHHTSPSDLVGVHINVDSLPTEAGKVEVVSSTSYYYNPGNLATLQNCSNITLKAENPKGAVLNWTSYSSHGTFFPGTDERYGLARSDAQYVDMTNPRPWPYPSWLISFASTTHNIVVDGLSFTTRYPLKTTASRTDSGGHLGIEGNYVQVQNCAFAYSPGFSIKLFDATDTHIDANSFINSSGDGINLDSSTIRNPSSLKKCTGTWIVGNVLSDVRDDAIVLTGDNNHAIYNYITNCGWRGFLVHTSTNSEVGYNTVAACAGYGIEVSPQNPGGDNFPATSYLSIHHNSFSGVGSVREHLVGSYSPSRSVIVLDATSNVTVGAAGANTLNYYNGANGGNANDAGVRATGRTTGQSAPTVRAQNTFNGFPFGTDVVIP